eukprot:gb/GEZN01015932.1/.p1 GENE.gb/GEZN01015932.1/~~gb/GEZN01015932.1/.p1  ORF type:complete len:214 (-),score=37.82 gb/GEZN01015932.1/:212-853(-)
MSDSLLGLVGDGYVLLVADCAQARSVVVFKHDQDKIVQLDKSKLMAVSGDVGDRVQFAEYIAKNLALYSFRARTPLSTKAAANYARKELAEALRSKPYQVNSLIGGFDEACGASLYFMDYMATLHPVPFGAQGYGSYFTLSTFDKMYKPDMSLEEGKEVMRACVKVLQTRMVLSLKSFKAKIVDKDGIREISLFDEESSSSSSSAPSKASQKS